jgi:hypothetical protein
MSKCQNKWDRSEPFNLRVLLPNPQRKGFHDCFLKDKDEKAKCQGDAEDEAVHSLIAEETYTEDCQPCIRDDDDEDGVGEGDEQDNHEWFVGDEGFLPGSADGEADEREDIHEVSKQKQNVGLRGYLGELLIIDILLLVDRHPSDA